MILLKDVYKKIGNKTIINNINLTINKGITFIVGSSGAGKTTLLNLIGGLDSTSSGMISYNGIDIAINLNRYRAENVGFIFQDYNLISGLSVKNNIKLGLLYSEHKENILKIDSQIEEFDIKDEDQCVETLSGGEKQRVATIRSICKEADIILADEPTGNLDSTNSHLVFQALTNMKQDKYIVVVSHDLEMAKKYGDRIITMSDGKIINDTSEDRIIDNNNVTDVSTEKTSTYTNKINWQSVLMLGGNSLKKRLSKIFSIAIVVSITISALAILFSLNNTGNDVSKDVNVNYLESDLITMFYPFTTNVGYKETTFEQEDIEYIKNTYKPKSIVPVYKEGESWFFSNQVLTKDAIIKQINVDDFFEERIMSYDIEGRFVENDNEIILAEDIAKALFEDSCIGKEITLNNGSGESIVFEIVGINKTVNPFDEIYSIASSNKVKELLEKELTIALENRLELYIYMEEPKEQSESSSAVRTDGIYGPMKVIDGSEKYIFGKSSEKENEILISTGLLEFVLSGFEIEYEPSDLDIENGKISEELLEELTTKKLTLNHNGLFEVYITGVYKYDDIEMKFQPSFISKLKEIEPTVIESYFPQKVNVSNIKKEIDENEKFTCSLQLETLKDNVLKQTTYFELVIILIGFIMILVLIAMLSSFLKIVVLERKKEVGIIKSLGASNKDVLFTLLYDSMIISLVSVLLSFLITWVFLLLLPNIITDLSFVNFEYPLLSLIILGLFFTLFICFYTFFSLKKIVKETPADLLKQ